MWCSTMVSSHVYTWHALVSLTHALGVTFSFSMPLGLSPNLLLSYFSNFVSYSLYHLRISLISHFLLTQGTNDKFMSNLNPLDNGAFLAAVAFAWGQKVDTNTLRVALPPVVTLEQLAFVAFKVGSLYKTCM